MNGNYPAETTYNWSFKSIMLILLPVNNYISVVRSEVSAG